MSYEGMYRIKAASKDCKAESLEAFVTGALTICGNKGHLWKRLAFCSQYLATREKRLTRATKGTKNVLKVLRRHRKVYVCAVDMKKGLCEREDCFYKP